MKIAISSLALIVSLALMLPLQASTGDNVNQPTYLHFGHIVIFASAVLGLSAVTAAVVKRGRNRRLNGLSHLF
ncbi:MAG: hypothetical protein AAGA45_04795 [Verrucomicrobiota bacterium]